jgi:two-component system OmpR family sensor kinase
MTNALPDWSIRRRLTRRVLMLVAVAWIATIALATLFLDREINEVLNEELQSVAETTMQYLDAAEGSVIPRSIGVNRDNGERVLRVLRVGDPVPSVPWPALTTDGLHNVGGWSVLRLTAESAVIEVGHNNDWRREEMFEAASAFLVLILPLSGLLLWGLGQTLRQGFAPLEELAGQIAARKPEDLTAVPVDDLPAEVKPAAEALNQYIARIDAMRLAERQFIANASHELRTPVAAIRARLDLSADPEARSALPLLDGLTRRVERLLQMSRSEAGLGLGRGPADLVQITRLLVREVGQGARHPIRFDDADCESLWVAADADALAILIRNLLENAVDHGAGPVEVSLAAPARLTVRNPVTDAAFHDQPFAKRPGSPGSGLGLTIVMQLAEAIGAEVGRTLTADRAEFIVSFIPDKG